MECLFRDFQTRKFCIFILLKEHLNGAVRPFCCDSMTGMYGVWYFVGILQASNNAFLSTFADGCLVSLSNCVSCELHSSSRNSSQVSVACSNAKVISAVIGVSAEIL